MTTDARFAVPEGVTVDRMQAPRRVPFDAPWNWLAAGWRDLWTIPTVSLAYGALFAAAAALLAFTLYSVGAQSLFLALAGGFLLIGPLMAVGLYEASRRLARGEAVQTGDVLSVGMGAKGQLAFYGAVLLFVFMIWLQLAILLLMLFLGGTSPPPASEFVQALLFTPRGLGLLIAGSIVGGLIASLVFAMSVVAVRMLLIKQVDAVTAARASIAAVAANPKPMALWAALIVVIMGAGFVTFLAGLVVAFPLIGHATWHAFADVYGDSPAHQ